MITLETGVNIQDLRNWVLYKKIISEYGVNHIQISNVNNKYLPEVLSYIRNELDDIVEFSYKVNIDEIVTFYQQKSQVQFPWAELKYLIVPIGILTTLNQINVSSFDFFDFLVEAMRDRFICIEFSMSDKYSNDVSNSISSLKNIKEAHPSASILYSLNIENLLDITNLKKYTTKIRNYIGIVEAYIDSKYTKIIDQDDSFVELIDTLYWLPYRQQPLIFTNPASELEAVYQRYYSIVNQRGYTYF